MNLKTFLSGLESEDGQVWTYVLWIIIIAVVIGVIITQFGPIIGNHVTIGGTADKVAEEAAIAYDQSKGDMEKVYDVALQKLEESGSRLDGTISVVKGQNGEPDMMTVPVRKITDTYLFENVSYLCSYTEAKAFGEHSMP